MVSLVIFGGGAFFMWLGDKGLLSGITAWIPASNPIPMAVPKNPEQLAAEREVWLPEWVRKESYVQAAKTVKGALVNPSSAQFPASGFQGAGVVVSRQADGATYVATISSYVESTNVYNATVRSTWEATVKYYPNKELASRWGVEVTPDRSNSAFQSR